MNTLLEKLSGLSPEKRALLAERLPPLSFAQQRLWFLDQLEPGSAVYNVPTSVRLTGELDIDALSFALDEIVRRHESLRTVFVVIEEDPRQLILPATKNTLVVVNLSDLDPAARKDEVARTVNEESHKPFDLRTGPLLRVTLLCLGESENVLLLTMHHIICDRWSMSILIGELLTLYHAFVAGKPSPLPELTVQYADYARWQREWLSGEVLTNQLAYWRQKLGGTLPLLELPTDRRRPSVQTFRGARLPISMPEDLTAKLKHLGKQYGCTLYMTVLAAFQILLYRYTDQDDIVVGTPVSGRNRFETENLIGFFINTLVMRTDLSGAPTCVEVLNRVREVALGAYAHQELPFEKLVEELQPQRDLSRAPLFQVMFVLQNTPTHAGASLSATKLKLSRAGDEFETSNFDLTFTFTDSLHSLRGVIEYNIDLFDEQTIKRMAGHFQTLLQGMVENPEQQIGSLPLLSEQEREQLLATWNDTATEYPHESCIHELFEAQEERTPDAIALVFADEQLTYRELNERANQLAHHLRAKGIRTESRVGLYVERSSLLLVGLLGILKAGGTYVPLDPEYPAERLKYMLADAGINILLTQRRLQSHLSAAVTHVVLDEKLDPEADLPKRNPASLASAADAAYVIYTSGSTGAPKGVVCGHGNLVNVLTASVKSFGITGADRLPALASSAFDISLFELLTPLLVGGVVEVCGRDQVLEMKQLVQVVRRSTLLHTVPSLMRELLRALENERREGADAVRLRQLFIGGDSVAPALIEEMKKEFGEAEVRVLYGPTEATLFCTTHLVNGRERGRQQIGRPLANVRVRVCDVRGELTPVGVAGELYIGGAGVTRGYLGRDEDTNRVYVELDGERYYRTGDLVKWDSEGELEFVGRRDGQVKVRGYRIELGEIEAVLLAHEGVQDAVVVAREDGSEKRLVGYVAPANGDELSTADLREYLAERLPSYMVPGALVLLEELPLTPNGKVDRKALALREDVGERSNGASVLPQTAVEELLASIWAGVLRLESVGIEENFFELGGHSLLATQVMSRVREVFGVEVALRSLFEQPTVAGLAGKVEAALRGERGVVAPALERVSRERELPLSFAQQRLWFLDQLEPGSAFYNVPTAVRLQGELNVAALEQTLTEIVRRHEVLRTTFRSDEGQAVQVIGEAQRLEIPVTELSGLEEARELIDAEAQTPFDLSTGPLLRVKLLRLGAEEHVVMLTMHHIISDGWSMGVLLNEVATLYQAYSAGEESPLTELPIQYADYAVWQREWLQGEVLEAELAYWREQLGGELPVLELPTDRPRPEMQSFRGTAQFFQLGEQSTQSLRKLGQEQGCTLFMTLLAAFQTLLYRYSGQEEIVVGSPIAGRNRMELEKLIGFFVNTLVLRTDLSGGPTFVELLKRVREVALGAYAHQDVPFEKLVEELQPERDLSRSPLFQVMFIHQNAAATPKQSLPATGLQPVSTEAHSAKFDLTMSVTQRGEVLEGMLEYNTDLFEAETMARLVDHYQNLLQAVAVNPEQEIGALPLLSEGERRQLLEEWNDTAVEYPRATCLHELFEAQVERTPEAVALVFGEEQLTYAELNARANQLARHLRSLGVGPEVLVGICVERSVEMVVGLLGILKAGGAYVPLDPGYPGGRLAYLLEDAQVRVLLTQAEVRERLPQLGVSAAVLCLDAEWAEIAGQESGNAASGVTAENLAYVIYTSGSTGGPKGVCVTHGNVVHSTRARAAYYAEPVESFLLLSSFAFDSSVAGLFWTLSQGGRLVLLAEGAQQDVGEVRRAVAVQSVTHLLSLGSLYQLLLESEAVGRSLQTVIVAGEACRAELVDQHQEVMPGVALYNEYGPTEASVWSTAHECVGGEEPVPIGRPISNMQVYVLDEQQRVAPRGVRGELYLGGAGITRGYLGRAELTAERFVPHPFSAEAGARLYRTGDIAWYRADGALMYGGRVDEQVKVRGYRIELGEIEAVLLGHGGVREAVVVARNEAGGEKRLVGYVVADEQVAGLREYLKERLPSYMAPGALVQLEELPLTPNGKVDRKALALREDVGERSNGASVLPRTAVEELLASIWAGVLRLESVGIEENFFELGGHSLLATQVVSRVREVFGVEVALRSLFEQPTVAGLAGKVEAALRGERGVMALPLARVSRERELPLSFAQQRLWFLDQLEPGSAFYNVPTAVRLQGELNVEALEQTLSEIVRRHEVLRTTFKSINGQAVQVIGEAQRLEIPVTELSGLEEGEREQRARELIDAEAQTPFDLSVGPLLRVKLLRLGAEEHVVMLTMHHIVSDGWSMGLLLNEIATLYRAYSAGEESPLMELPIQYADYAVWQREWLQGEVLEAELAYWREQLGGELPVLELPTDRPRPAVQTFHGARVPFRLPESLLERVKAVSVDHDCTLFMTLLATLQTLLHRYSGQNEIIVGSPIAGRSRPELEPLIGMFLNQIVLRTDLSGDPPFSELLHRVRETALDAYAHQDLPFEKLVEELQPERDLSRSPLFQVDLTFQQLSPSASDARTDLKMIPMASEGLTSKFDLTFSLAEIGDAVFGTLEYNTDLFDVATIELMTEHFQNLLGSIVEHPEEKLSGMQLLSPTERQQLLVEWNESSTAYPQDSCIHELFEAQVERTPAATAVIFNEQQLTYAELNTRANQLAHHLRSMGVGAETLVGLCVERSVEMVVGLLGILKAGGAYVSLDPDYPAERLSFMLEDAGISVLLTQEHLLDHIPSHWALTFCLDRDWAELAGNPSTNLNGVAMQPENLAYVSYTSGSTGRPKGVSIPHGAVVSLLCPAEFVRLDERETVLQLAPLPFDASTFEVWGSLLNGARLVVMAAGPATLEEIAAVVRQQRVTTLWLTAGLFHLMVDEQLAALAQVKQMLAGGDVLSVEHSRKYLAAAGSVLVNGYGPTESTTFTSCEVLRGEEELAGATSVAIGRVVGGRRAYVVDEGGELVGRGIGGELYIGGAGLGRGYVQRAAETAARFVPDRWSGESGARLYRTGDVVRWKSEGKLEFKGRADGQVKLRGYRIELGEIEAVLLGHGGVREAVVVVRDEGGEKRLVGYVVLAAEAATEVEELREYLAQRLPSYMVPRVLVPLNTLPLTSNGKVDRAALPAPSLHTEPSDTADKLPTTIEEMLVGVWSEVLKIERVGVHDNFFDLGGHSLLATQVFSRIREVFAVEMSLRSLFENPTIAELAVVVEIALRATEGVEAPPIKRRPEGQKIPLSFAQQRLWFLDRLEPGSPFYNVPLVVRLRGQLNIEALERTLNEVVRRHEVLRTTFRSIEGEPEQVIHEALELKLEVEQVSAEEQEQLRRLIKEESSRGFDLTQGPLLRVRLLRLSQDEHVVLFTMHHIVSDGWSMGVLTNEIATLYRAFSAGEEPALPEMSIQYADYAVWQREWLQGEVLAGELEYWRKRLGGQLPTLNLPTDRPRPAVPTYRGAYRSFALPVDLSEKVKQLGRDQGCTLFMTLMAAFKTLLFRYSGQDDIIAGTIVANRNNAEIEPLIGLFINTLAIRTDLSGDPTFKELMARVKENMLTAHVHQEVPFEKLVSELQTERELNRAPLFQVTFGVQNAPGGTLELPGLSLQMLNTDEGAVRYDLTHWVYETPGGLVFSWSYSTDLFDLSTIVRMQENFATLLKSIVENPEAQLSTLEILSETQKRQQQEKEQERTKASYRKFMDVKPKAFRLARDPDPEETAPSKSNVAGGER